MNLLRKYPFFGLLLLLVATVLFTGRFHPVLGYFGNPIGEEKQTITLIHPYSSDFLPAPSERSSIHPLYLLGKDLPGKIPVAEPSVRPGKPEVSRTLLKPPPYRQTVLLELICKFQV